MESPDAALYRQKAADMRRQAETAPSDLLRTSYLTIAAEWERMAQEAEQAARPAPPPKRKDGQKDDRSAKE